MSKRKLSRQQAWRIEKIQDERAKRAQRRGSQADQALASNALGPEREGLITAHYGTQVTVEAPTGEQQRCHLRANLEGLVTGDQVVWCAGDPMGVVVAQLERKSALLRPDAHGNLKPVAANIDQIMLVIAPLPEPHANLIDRYLVAASAVSIEPTIVLNKCDLLLEEPALRAKLHALLAPYPALGYKVIEASALEGGTQELQQALAGRTSVFVGQSGVGKSSLVNQLVPAAELRVGALSTHAGKGTHTTTTAHLLHLGCGGSLIDSPGIREFGLWHMDRASIEQGFIEFRPLLGHCRFRDCSHTQEPGCAILDAVRREDITPRRMASYRHILASLN